MAQTIAKIYLHWSATDYNWVESGLYHTVVQGNGMVRRLTGYDQPLSGHTRGRSTDSVSLCLACMGDEGWASYPPTTLQIDNLCKEVANLALRLGWKPEDITIQRILTHAEAAANRDVSLNQATQVSGWSRPNSTPQGQAYAEKAKLLGLPHENYGPTTWFDQWPGGYQERWDLWQLAPTNKPGEGGVLLRQRIQQYLQQGITAQKSSITLRSTTLFINNQAIGPVKLLTDQRAYAKLTDLLKAYQIPWNWRASYGYVNLTTTNYQVKYLADTPLLLGYPTIDIYLNRPEDVQGNPLGDPTTLAQPFLQGIVVEGDLYVMVSGFCQELGIALQVAQDMSLYLGTTKAPDPPPQPAPNPIAPAKSADILRICDIYLGETTLIGNGYLLKDSRCYIKIANLAAAYSMGLVWNNGQRYLNVITNQFQAKFLADQPMVTGYVVVPLFLNRSEDSQGNPTSTADQPFMRGLILENSIYVSIAEFCQELGIVLRVDPDFSIHLATNAAGANLGSGTGQPPTSSGDTTVTSTGMDNPNPGGSNGMPPYITTPPPTVPPSPPTPTPPIPPSPPIPPTPVSPVPVSPTPGTSINYTVRSGDTLAGIARQFFGENGDWRVIAQFNQITDPTQLRVGQVLEIPLADTTPPLQPDPQPPVFQTPSLDTYRTYTVKSGDTLGKIAAATLGSDKLLPLISVINDISNPSQIRVGQVLQIPPKQVTVPNIINTPQGKQQPSTEIVSFSIDSEVAYADRPNGLRDRVGRFYEKGLFRGGNEKADAFIARSSNALKDLKLSSSESLVIAVVSANEGSLDAINTWDNSFLSFGIFQWTAGPENSSGELPALLLLLKAKAPTLFQHYFGRFGLDVQRESSITGWLLLGGNRLTTTAQKSVLRHPLWAYRFALAGLDTVVQSVQVVHAISRLDRFYFNAEPSLDNQSLSKLFTSELGVALLLDNHVNRPAYVVAGVAEALKQLGMKASQLASGGDAEEMRVIDRYLTIRQTYGSYPMTDARERGERAKASKLSKRRGSFVSNRTLRS